MIPALKQYPRFEKGSPSSEYQQIINFCTNYLEGLLISLIHQEIDVESFDNAQQLESLQQRMSKRERTLRHAFQFQIEKSFADFKTISRPRLRLNHAGDYDMAGLSSHKAAQIQPAISQIALQHQQRHQTALANSAIRLKKLVHRSDRSDEDNPISPIKLCNAFQACIDTLNLPLNKNLLLLQLFDSTLENQLENFYQQIDLGLYYLDILPELTDPALFVAPPVENDELQQPTLDTMPETAADGIATAETIVSATPDEGDENTASDAADFASLHQQREKNQPPEQLIEEIIDDFKFNTENGTLNFERQFGAMTHQLLPLLPAKQQSDVERFASFYTSLLNNSLLSTPLKTQLSRLSSPLLQLVLVDPFFFRSSAHPVNDFLQSIIDFELRFKHHGASLLFLSRIIDELLQVERPALCDYQPLIERYETFKAQEDERLTRLRLQHEQEQEQLKQALLQLINEITANLVVEQETLQFFYDDWQLYLLKLANESGMDSSAFEQALEQARILSWMLDERLNDEHPDHPEVSFKTLLREIDQQLDAMNFSGEHRNRIRKQLVREYKNANQRVDLTFIPSASGDSLKQNITVLSHDSTQPVFPQDLSANGGHTLKRGDWVEIQMLNLSNRTRAKLHTISDYPSSYVFVDRRGYRIYQCDQSELEAALTSGKIRRLQKPQLHKTFS